MVPGCSRPAAEHHLHLLHNTHAVFLLLAIVPASDSSQHVSTHSLMPVSFGSLLICRLGIGRLPCLEVS